MFVVWILRGCSWFLSVMWTLWIGQVESLSEWGRLDVQNQPSRGVRRCFLSDI